MKLLKWFGLTFGSIVVWLTINVVSTKQGWFVNSEIETGNASAFMSHLKSELDNTSKGNAVAMLILDGKVYDSYAVSKGEPVNADTVFGVASLGKWVAATGVMTLVESGALSLDEPVDTYLTRWSLPPSDFSHRKVTIRRLLSHTAGITDGLGHNGFPTRESIQPLVSHLTKAQDADEGADGRVRVGIEPGTAFKYSGGSYNLLQLIVEEVSGMTFEQYMKEAVFNPLKMYSTTYRHDEVANLAQYFDENGNERAYPFYTSLAATGLYTSANDIHKYLQVFISNTTDTLLSPSLIKEMREPSASMMGMDIWGLGTMLFADNNENDFIIGHGGQSPSLNATARINPHNGNGIILFETGNKSLAADSATLWTLWETGNPDMYMLRHLIPSMFKRVLAGSVVILILSVVIAWVRSRRNRA